MLVFLGGQKSLPGQFQNCPGRFSLFLNGQRESGLNGFCVCGGIFRSNVQNHRVPAGFQGSERLRRESDRAAVLLEFRVISPNSAVAGLVMLSTCTSGAVWD